MKVAIIHEWLVIVGGAEKVLKAMLDVFQMQMSILWSQRKKFVMSWG